MSYIYPAPGVSGQEVTLTLSTDVTGNLAVPAMQDVTVNNANDVFTWTQLDQGSKQQIATTATNSVSMNIVVNNVVFFGDSGATTGSAENLGLYGLSRDKTLVTFELFFGNESDTGNAAATLSGEGYITGLAPTVSADSPVWVSPVTITVDGEYTLS